MASATMAAKVSAAPRLYFDPSSVTVTHNLDFTVNIQIDAGASQVFGADALINLPLGDIAIKSITNGGYFTDFSNPAGTAEIHGFLSAPNTFKTGVGTFAVVTFTPLKSAGTDTVGFTCSASGNDTEILDVNGTNILACSSLNQLALTYSGTQSPNPTPTPTGDNGNQNNNPSTNGCGGTCGSNYNCDAGLYCYTGFCRNPFCNTTTNCICVTPTPTPKATSKALVKPTPAVIALVKSTPFPTPGASVAPVATPVAQNQAPSIPPFVIWAILSIIAIIVLAIAVSSLTKKGPPQINPPTTAHSVEPPMPEPQAPTPNEWQGPPTGYNG